MTRWISGVVLVHAFSFAATSCGGESSNSPSPGSGGAGGGGNAGSAGSGASDAAVEAGGPSDMTPDGICSFYADRYCGADQRCSYDFAPFWNDLPMCKERMKLHCLSWLTSPSVNESANRLVECANALSALSCERYVDYDRRPESCMPLPGQLPDGAPCILATQCQGGACTIGARAACGTCKSVSRIGGACTDENDCLDFMPCVNGVCAPHPVAGEPCDGLARSCLGPSVCRDLDANGIGKCGKPSPAGTPCDPTKPDICDFTNAIFCDQFTNTCTMGEKTGKVGDQCVDVFSCPFVAYCDGTDSCRLKPREGQPCNPDNLCLTPARCIDGVCKIRDPAACK